MNAPQETAVAAAAPTLADIARQYLAAYTGRDTTRAHRIGAWVRLLGERPLIALSPDDIDVALSRLAEEPARVYGGLDADGKPIFRRKAAKRSGPTLNRYLVALAALYAWARRSRLAPRGFESPTRHVDKFPENRGRVRYLTDDERSRLLWACKESAWPRLHLLVSMALTTGARRGELLALRWCDIDLDRAEALLHDTKNGDRRVLVLLPSVCEELQRFAPRDATTSTALVFRSRLRPSQPYAMEQAFRDALALADIKNFRFHDCRHTAASYMAQHGASLLEIADTLGHRQLRMVQRYAHLNTDSRRRLMARVFEGKL
ncbi:MAG: site-specific integrase [Thiomonas sp.]|uniref:tyrosine-type recombinase/integrase n=1 Tax=Thiomonas sp. TaxID=2047785 RepID=UPI002A367D3B|nr:site-specific integrase [Thiomonas sp.]MDY0328915.1 site-specific integrase [Thiomonas sp.]